MKTELKKLDSLLKEKRADLYVKLNPPLTEAGIADLEKEYKVVLPDDVKELYLWKNGQSREGFKAFVSGFLFEPLEDVLLSAKEFTAMIGDEFFLENQWNENWFPIFRDGGGSRICYDQEGTFTGEKGQLLTYLQGYDDRHVIAPNLSGYLQHLIKYYEQTSSDEFDSYFDISTRIEQWKQVFILDEPI